MVKTKKSPGAKKPRIEIVPQESNKAIENKVAAKSKPKMKGKKEGKEGRKENKEPAPKKKTTKEADQKARVALGSGDITKDEVVRKKEQDLRTLYIRFGKREGEGKEAKLPTTAEEIKALHSDIRFVRTPRTATKGGGSISYAFLEFGSPDECKAAQKKLATTQYKGKEIVVDFVGENSKNQKQKAQAGGDQKSSRLNPTRLFICGLAPGVNKTNLKEMFPKASHADIPARSKKKGTSYGFVQFASPGDAKAAFDAAKDLTIADHKITVLFAKMSESKPEVLQKKAEKRKAKEEKKKEAKRSKPSEDKENIEGSDDDENDEESEEEEEEAPKKVKKEVKVKKELKKEVKEEKVVAETVEEEEENDEESEEEEAEDNDEESDAEAKTAEGDGDEQDDEDDDDDDEDDDDDDE